MRYASVTTSPDVATMAVHRLPPSGASWQGSSVVAWLPAVKA
jgi:hypothetical protein